MLLRMAHSIPLPLQTDERTGVGAGSPEHAPRAVRRGPRLLAVVAVALPLLLWGVDADWRLLHEDNGALHTTFALAHVRLGLAATRGHAVFVDRTTGSAVIYGHHPPGVSLLVAASFVLTGSEQPWAARLVPIACQLVALIMLAWLLLEVLPQGAATAAALFAAVVPMGAYFGRMVNFEAPGLAAVVAQLLGWWWLRTGRRRQGRALVWGGVVFGGFIDWPPLVAAFGIAAVELASFREQAARRRALMVGGAAAVTLCAVLAHLWWAGGGTLAPLGEVLSRSNPAGVRGNALGLLGGVLDNVRRYLTLSGVLAAGLVAAGLVRPHGRLSAWLGLGDRADFRVVLGGCALAPALISGGAPSWARGHAYWQAYFLPFVVLSFGLLWRALAAAGNERRVLRRMLLAVVLAEVVATSSYMLTLRHTRVSEYAVRETARLRERFLAPAGAPGSCSETRCRGPKRARSRAVAQPRAMRTTAATSFSIPSAASPIRPASM